MLELSLGDKQRLFARLVGKLLEHIYTSGYEASFGETYRTPEQAALNAKHGIGIASSLHTMRLAIDVQLFKDGVYLKDSTQYALFGTYWKSLHPLARWGGDFSNPDGNHFSITHGGKA